MVFKTIDQKPQAFDAADVGMIEIDERCPEWVFDKCIPRLRNGGILFITATQDEQSAWLDDRIVDKPSPEKYHQTVSQASFPSSHIVGRVGPQAVFYLRQYLYKFLMRNVDL